MVIVVGTSAVDHRSGETSYDMCCFFATYTTFGSRRKDWLYRRLSNVSEWLDWLIVRFFFFFLYHYNSFIKKTLSEKNPQKTQKKQEYLLINLNELLILFRNGYQNLNGQIYCLLLNVHCKISHVSYSREHIHIYMNIQRLGFVLDNRGARFLLSLERYMDSWVRMLTLAFCFI